MNDVLLPNLSSQHHADIAEPQYPDIGDETHRAVGRFRETRGMKVMRAAFAALSRITPTVAAHLGYRLIATPPRVAERRWQAALRHAACVSYLPFADSKLAVYEWHPHQTQQAPDARPTILMVHGWGARATHMGRMIRPLTNAGFRVVSFDAPAHGESSGKTTDLIEFAGAIDAVAKFAGPLHCILAHSFGAAMAMLATRDWGVTADRLILISSFNNCRWFGEAFGKYVGLTPSVRERMLQMMVERHNGRIDWNQLSVIDMLRDTQLPALLIHDEQDAEIPFQHSVTLLRGAPNADLHITSGFGHHRLLGNASVINRVINFVSADDPVLGYAVPTSKNY